MKRCTRVPEIQLSGSIRTNRPSRIISLSASATEDLYAVGAGKQVVAVLNLEPKPIAGVISECMMLASFTEAGPPVASLQRERINLRLRMRELWARLQDAAAPLTFHSLFEGGSRPSRLEVIVTFLAVLELLRLGRIAVFQSHPLADLVLIRREPEERRPDG